MVDGQVCIYSLNECLSEPGHNPTPRKQKEVRIFVSFTCGAIRINI